jgi:isoleucyl-tRNA synthetase
MEEIIKDELNVKDVVYRENEEDLVRYKAQPDYRRLGSQLGRDMKSAAEKIRALNSGEIRSVVDGATLQLDLGGRTLDLTADDLVVSREEKESLKVLNEGSLTVALDPELTEELMQEGAVRDLVRTIQNLRKE